MDLRELSDGKGERHPWESARAEFFSRVASLYQPAASVLDLGSGDGYFANEYLRRFPAAKVDAVDPNYRLDTLNRLRHGLDQSGRINFCLSPAERRYDLIFCLDVCEHVEDDAGFLKSLAAQHMHEGSRLVLSVPAWPRLFSRHDQMLGHYRRYSPRRMRSLLIAAGLDPLRSGGLFHGLLLPRAMEVMLEKRRRREPASRPAGDMSLSGPLGEWQGSRAVTRVLTAALKGETLVSRAFSAWGWEVPGLSWWAVCRRGADGGSATP